MYMYYKYDETTLIYIGEVETLMAYSTDQRPPFENLQNGQLLCFNELDNKWNIIDNQLIGTFYDVSNGSKIEKILAKDIEKYTNIEPTIKTNNGDIISFDTHTGKWLYSVKGDITIKKEQDLLLQETKTNKQKEVIEFYFNLRFFNVINGHIAKFIAAEADYINTQGKLHYGYNTISSNIIGLEDQAERLGINKSTLFYNYVDSIATYTQVPYLKLIEIREKIAEQRSKCAVLRDMHNAIISQLPNIKMIEQYNYKLDIRPFLDDKTKVATSIQDIIIIN